MRRTALITGILGGAPAALLSLLMFYFSMTGGFAARNPLFEAVVLALMGAAGLVGAIYSTRDSNAGGWLMSLSTLVGIYYVWDVSDLLMVVPTILMAAGSVTAFVSARSE